MKLINDIKFLREDYKFNENLIEFESNRLNAELAHIEGSSIIALVGGYGTGKSTTLYSIQNDKTASEQKWFQFDAWRYPERKGLWDGLILEIAKQIGSEHKIVKKIDGNKSIFGKWGSIATEIFGQFGDMIPKQEIEKITLDPESSPGVAKVAEKASSIFGRSPAKRAYEMERILADVLLSVKEKKIYIVAEDVDRSGSDGINFLETLNFFIKNNEQVTKSNKQIIIIAPISDQAYINNKDSLFKCIDTFIEYKPTIKSSKSFISHVFTKEALGAKIGDELLYLTDIESFINTLLETDHFNINIRKLKLIIRHTNQRFSYLSDLYEKVDWRAVFVVEAMRMADDSKNQRSLLEAAHGSIPQGTVFSAFLKTIHQPNEHVYQYKYANDRSRENRELNPYTFSYKFIGIKSQAETTVWEGWRASRDSTTGFIADFYIN
jgi:hypothetical protein